MFKSTSRDIVARGLRLRDQSRQAGIVGVYPQALAVGLSVRGVPHPSPGISVHVGTTQRGWSLLFAVVVVYRVPTPPLNSRVGRWEPGYAMSTNGVCLRCELGGQ